MSAAVTLGIVARQVRAPASCSQPRRQIKNARPWAPQFYGRNRRGSNVRVLAASSGLVYAPRQQVTPQDWLPIRQAPGPPQQQKHVSPSHSAPTVEVQFSVQYKCSFGQHLAILGSPQGWQMASAAALTWAAGDRWSTVLRLPVGQDVEYKYVVMEGAHVQRWQEGPNNRLALHSPGVLVQVTDCWSRESRQVYELGLPAAAWQHVDAAADAAGAAATTRLQNNITVFTLASSSSRLAASQEAAAAAAAAPSLAPPEQLQPLLLQLDEEEQQEPAQCQDQLQAAQSRDDLVQLKWAVPADEPQEEHQQGLWTDGSGLQLEGSLAAQQEQEHAQLRVLEPDALTLEVAQLIPMLQCELEAALQALASHPNNDCSEQAALLSEGQAVLAALREQQQYSVALSSTTSASSSSSSNGRGSVGSSALSSLLSSCFSSSDDDGLLDQVEAAFASCSPDSALAAAAASANVTHAAAAAAAAAVAAAAADLSQQLSKQQASLSASARSSSPGSSPGSSMVSATEEDITAALLSDDFEDACWCLVDAICSCQDHAHLPECREFHSSKRSSSRVAAAGQQQGPEAAFASSSSNSNSSFVAGGAAAAEGAAELVPVSAAALAASCADAAEARAAAFAGVQQALEKSAALLDALADPSHPLMLEADRDLAAARRQMGHLLAA